MPRKIRIGEVKTRFLDLFLVLFSLAAMFGGLGMMVFLIIGFPTFQLVPFLEYFVLFVLGMIGFRAWRQEVMT